MAVIQNVQDPNYTFTAFLLILIFNQLISFTTATATVTMIVFDSVISWYEQWWPVLHSLSGFCEHDL